MTQDILFTSDTHFFHKKIQEFCPDTRKGKDVQEMNELIIEAWNSKVRPGDMIYHLGDFSFGKEEETLELIGRLNGIIHLIKGNHDGSRFLRAVGHKFASVKDKRVLRVDDLTIVLDHFPIESWDRMHHGSLHFHGHLHGDDHHACRIVKNRIDVGVDCRPQKDMAPFHLDEVLQLIKERNANLDELNKDWDSSKLYGKEH